MRPRAGRGGSVPPIDLAAALPSLLPAAIRWAEGESARALRAGTRLSNDDLLAARHAGVARPDRVRVEIVEALPEPEDAVLRAAGREAGLLASGMIGLTLGYAVFLRRGHDTRRALSHELRHVQQYESAGGIAEFLPAYLAQIVETGYAQAPFEADARAHERD